MLWTPDEAVILQGGELFVSALGPAYRLSNVRIARVDFEFRPSYVDAFGYNGEHVGRAYTAQVGLNVNLALCGFGGMVDEPNRREMLRRLCANVSVKELFGVINGKLNDRTKS